MEITIRQYEERDRAALTKCLEDLQDHEASVDPIHYRVRKEGFGLPYVENLLENIAKKDGVIYLAENDDAVVGILACVIKHHEKQEILARSSNNPYGYVVELYVAPEFRNKAVGSSLMIRAEEYFRSKGCDFASVDVFAPNTRAYDFYKKIGYSDREVNLLKKL